VAKGTPFGQLSQKLTPSSVIKGCWQLSGGHRGDRTSDRTTGSAAVADFQAFVDAGINTFDTGPEECGYGPSEKIIGEYLRQAGDQEIQVFTKLCCVGQEMYKLPPQFVRQRMDRTRSRLGVESLDLVQFYWNDYGSAQYVDAALYLQDEVAAGRVKNVALTNFGVDQMEKMWDAGVRIAANQIQYSLLDRRPENGMVDFCRAHNVALLPYGVMAGGFLSERYLDLDAAKVSVDTSSKQKYASVLRKVGSWDWLQELLVVLKSVADKHNVSIANVATKWVLDKDTVPAVIIGARNAAHLDDHRRLSTFSLDAADVEAINRVLARGKKPKGDCYAWERGLGEF